MKDLQKVLYEKMEKEQSDFKQKLKALPPEDIMDKAYELTIREDILMLAETEDFDTGAVKELLKLKNPLSACYDNWLKTDNCTHMETLRESVDCLANNLLKRSGKKHGDIQR